MEINDQIKEKIIEIEQEIAQMDQTEAMVKVWGTESTELANLLEEYPTIIQLGANIGLGKSTTTNIIGKFGGAKTFFEDVDNQLLHWYYENMNEYSERLQIDVINQRFYSYLIAKKDHPGRSLVFDRTPYEDLIFADVLAESGLMSKSSYDFCTKYFVMKKNQIEKNHRKDLGKNGLNPDLVIILKSSLENGWKRVLARERSIEVRQDAGKGVGLSKDFYQALHDKYETFPDFLKKYYEGPILILGRDSLEVGDSTNTKGQLYTVKAVKEALKIIHG